MSKITPHFFVLGIPEKDDRCPNAVYFLRTYSGVSMYATDSKNRIFPVEVGSPSPISGLISPKGTISIRLNGYTTEIDVSKSILDKLTVPTFQNIIDSENFGEARFISGVEWEDDGEEVSLKKNDSYFGISGTSVNINSDDLRILNSTSDDEGKLLIPDGSGSFKLVEPPFPKINDASDNTTEVLSSKKTRELIEGKVDKEAGKGLSSNDFTNIHKEKLEQQRDTIIISGNKFTYIPAIGNDGSSFQLGDIAKDGWINESTFGRVLTYKGTGDATLLSSWETLQSVKLTDELNN